jgi:hypothetical protein
MPVQLEVIREKNVVLQTYFDPLDSAQLNELRHNMSHIILPAATHKLHIIADIRSITHLPGSFIGTGARMLQSRHPNTGMIVCVSNNPLLIAMVRALSGLAPRQPFEIVCSLEEAHHVVDYLLQSADMWTDQM